MTGFGAMLKDYLDYYKISESDFADRLGISFKHLNEIVNGKTNISSDLMFKISALTGIDVNLILYVEHKKEAHDMLYDKYKTDSNIKKMLNSYYLNDMSKKKWITLKDKDSLVQDYIDLLDYLGVTDLDVLNKYIDKRFLFKKKKDADINKIYIWIRHCDSMLPLDIDMKYNQENLQNILKKLETMRCEKFDSAKLIKLFRDNGIYLVIEDALPGTKIRGCSKVLKDIPAIYMTKLYKEKASFYFALYHELYHIKTDYNRLKNKTIICNDSIEKDADTFAINMMIEPKVWSKILENYSDKEKIALENNVPLSFLYSRLAYEKRIKYTSKEYLKNRETIY